MRYRGSWIAALLLLALLVSACSSGAQDKSAGDAASVNSQASSADMAEAPSEGKATTESTSEAEAAVNNSAEEPASADARLPNAPSPSQVAGAGFNSQDLSSGLNKKLMYKANIVMEIQDYGKAQSEVRNTVTLSGGYIVNFSETQSASEKGGTFIVKVPANGFSSFRLTGEHRARKPAAQHRRAGRDGGIRRSGIQAQGQANHGGAIRCIHEKATKTTDLVAFANELERIQAEIEQMKGRMRYIDQNVAYSTVEIRLYETPQKRRTRKRPPFKPRLGSAFPKLFRAAST